ncbi:MAG: hypothetical protein ABFS28_09445 [Bacteroidota bacterium]
MDIDRNNYEAYLLDLMEGNLSLEDQQRLRDFMKLNPDCAMLYDHNKAWILETDQVNFPGKDQLKKELPHSASVLTESNFDLFSIARMEGDLTISQAMEHEAVVENDPLKRRDWAQWQQARLQATHEEYRGKDELKKSTGIKRRVIWLSMISTAAAVTLLLTLLRMDTEVPETEVAVETPEQVPESPMPEEVLAVSDEPHMFSIKSNPDRPVESVGKNETERPDKIQDSLQLLQARKIESGPVRLASYESYSKELVKQCEYDQIKALDIPPSDIHTSSLSLAQISEINLQEVFDDFTEEKNISLWSVAKAGINGINRITGSEISLLASKDDQGDISGFRLKTKRFSVTRPIDRSE